jgi:hypothetical protein
LEGDGDQGCGECDLDHGGTGLAAVETLSACVRSAFLSIARSG